MTITLPRDPSGRWLTDLQTKVETLLTDLDQQLDDDPETPSGLPYDGCLTCQIRETLTVAYTAFNEQSTPPAAQE